MLSTLTDMPTRSAPCFGSSARLSLVCGPMFAGKTSQLIADYQAHLKENRHPIIFAPAYDTRHKSGLRSHDDLCIAEENIHRVSSAESVVTHLRERASDRKAEVLLFDEAQFFHAPMFTGDLLHALRQYSHAIHQRARLEIAFYGLDMDARGRAFPAIEAIQTVAGIHVKKLVARCHICGANAPYTKRIASLSSDSQYAVGGSESYQPACREHWL